MKTPQYAKAYRNHSRRRPAALSKQITEIISPKVYLLLCRPVRLSVNSWYVVLRDRKNFENKVALRICFMNTTRTSFYVDTGSTCHVRNPVTTSAICNGSLELQALWRHHLRHMAMINFICRAANTNYRGWPTPCFQHYTFLTLPWILRSQKTVKLSSLSYNIRMEFMKKWLCVATGFVLMSCLNQ